MRLITVVGLSLYSALTLARGGGEGPCPVPDIPSQWISEKSFHSAGAAVRGMQSLDQDKTLLLKTEKGHEVFIYDEGGMCLTSPSYAVFSNPLSYVPIATLQPKPFPAWVESSRPVLKDGTHFFRAVKYDHPHKTHYRVVGIEMETKELKGFCDSPKVRNLRVSRGSIYPNAYFHSIELRKGGADITLYHLDLLTCAWTSEATYREPQLLPVDAPLVRFGQGLGFVLPLADRILWRDRTKSADYGISAKDVSSLGNNASVLLVRDQKNTVSLFIPSIGVMSRIMEDAVHYDDELFTASEQGDRLFIATSTQLPASSGVYEFLLKPIDKEMEARYSNTCPYSSAVPARIL